MTLHSWSDLHIQWANHLTMEIWEFLSVKAGVEGMVLPIIRAGNAYFTFENAICKFQVSICQPEISRWAPKNRSKSYFYAMTSVSKFLPALSHYQIYYYGAPNVD